MASDFTRESRGGISELSHLLGSSTCHLYMTKKGQHGLGNVPLRRQKVLHNEYVVESISLLGPCEWQTLIALFVLLSPAMVWI